MGYRFSLLAVKQIKRQCRHLKFSKKEKKSASSGNKIYWNRAGSQYKNKQMPQKFEFQENWDWCFVLPRDHWKDDEFRKKKIFLATLFLLKQKAGVMKESQLSLVSRTKNVFSWRKVHWVFFLERRTKFEWEKKNSMDFPSGHHPFASGQHHFASGENNCKKFFAIPQYPHPYIIFWQIKTPDFIFQLLSIISHP